MHPVLKQKRRLPLIRTEFIGKRQASLRYILLFVASKSSFPNVDKTLIKVLPRWPEPRINTGFLTI